jgi:hypothetical protein
MQVAVEKLDASLLTNITEDFFNVQREVEAGAARFGTTLLQHRTAPSHIIQHRDNITPHFIQHHTACPRVGTSSLHVHVKLAASKTALVVLANWTLMLRDKNILDGALFNLTAVLTLLNLINL